MGRSNSKLSERQQNPIQMLQLQENKRQESKIKNNKIKQKIEKSLNKETKKNNKNSKTSWEQLQLKSADTPTTKNSMKNLETTVHLNTNHHSETKKINELNNLITQKTRIQLENDLCTFIMNQIALSQQFSKNYESEIQTILFELMSKETELNQLLEKHSLLIANPLDAIISKYLKFKVNHGPQKDKIQLIQPQKIFVVFENIDIARLNDANYDSISPLYRVNMETDFPNAMPLKEDDAKMLYETKWKGYVRLKVSDATNYEKTLNGLSDNDYTDTSSGYCSTSNYSTKSMSTITSGSYYMNTDYDYFYIEHLNSNHPLKELQLDNQNDKLHKEKVLPESCIAVLGSFIDTFNAQRDIDDYIDDDDDVDDDDYDDIDDDVNNDSTIHMILNKSTKAFISYQMAKQRRNLLLESRYLNSKEFMRYFAVLMKRKLAQQLYISENELNTSTYRGCSIHTKQYELIPAIHIAQNAHKWPDCAFQFKLRERPIHSDPITGQQFQWPSSAMIKRIEHFGFHVIPIGYTPKRQRNRFRELEWRIVFPKAERYLEQHLASAHVKVLMMAKALIKTFIEPNEENNALMFVLDHLRTHLFWEVERNYFEWPEEFLGEILMRFIKTFMMRLSEKCLPDFFIIERNLFENIPEYSLAILHSIFSDITANPLMHIIVAMRNLHYVDERFFPKLNFKKLFHNLSENNIFKLKMLAKNTRKTIDIEKEDVQQETSTSTFLTAYEERGAKGLIATYQNQEKSTNGKLRKRTYLMKRNLQLKKQENEQKRKSIDSIDLEFFFRNNTPTNQLNIINVGIENLRRTNILELFIDHLNATIWCSIDSHAIKYAQICLSQAQRLCLLYDNAGCDFGAKEYFNQLQEIEQKLLHLTKNYQSENYNIAPPPALPLRVSIESLKCQQITETSLSKIHKINIINNETQTRQQNVEFSNACHLSVNTTIDAQKSSKFNDLTSKKYDEVDQIEMQMPVYQMLTTHERTQLHLLAPNDHNDHKQNFFNENLIATNNEQFDNESSIIENQNKTKVDVLNIINSHTKSLRSLTTSTEKLIMNLTQEKRTNEFFATFKSKAAKVKKVLN